MVNGEVFLAIGDCNDNVDVNDDVDDKTAFGCTKTMTKQRSCG